MQIGKEEVEQLLSENDIILYRKKNPKYATKKML